MTESKVYALKLRYVLKYEGYSKKQIKTLMDEAFIGGKGNKFYDILEEIDPYHLVRLTFMGDMPVLYTLSKSNNNASSKFLEVLVPLMEAQEAKDLKRAYNKDNLVSMVFNNTKWTTLIDWDYTIREINEDVDIDAEILGI